MTYDVLKKIKFAIRFNKFIVIVFFVALGFSTSVLLPYCCF